MADAIKPINQKNFLTLSQALAAGRDLAHFHLCPTYKEARAINLIKVVAHINYDNFDNLPELKTESEDFLKKIGNSPEVAAQVSNFIDRSTKEAVTAFGTETAWVIIRASLPNDFYDVPRWHQDGYYFSPFEGEQRKIVMTLKGSQTLFAGFPSEAMREVTRRMKRMNVRDLDARRELGDMVARTGRIETAAPLQGSVFVAGPLYAAVHSEPPIHEPRLFVSILPGSREGIKEFYERSFQSQLNPD